MNGRRHNISILRYLYQLRLSFVLLFIWPKSNVTQNLVAWMFLFATFWYKTWEFELKGEDKQTWRFLAVVFWLTSNANISETVCLIYIKTLQIWDIGVDRKLLKFHVNQTTHFRDIDVRSWRKTSAKKWQCFLVPCFRGLSIYELAGIWNLPHPPPRPVHLRRPLTATCHNVMMSECHNVIMS